MQPHPAANIFPLLSDEEVANLAENIRSQGLLEPIVTVICADGINRILDGRNRYRACSLAGVEPRTVPWDGSGGSPVTYALSKNLHRRHLTPTQRSAIAVEVLPLLEAEARERQVAAAIATNAKIRGVVSVVAPPTKGRARDIAGRILCVSGRSVQEAKTIGKQAPDVLEEVRAGTLSLPQGRAVAKIPDPKDRQAAIAHLKNKAPTQRVNRTNDHIELVHKYIRLLDKAMRETPSRIPRQPWWKALQRALDNVAPLSFIDDSDVLDVLD